MMILEGNFIEAAAVSQAGSLSYDLSTSIEPLSRLAEFDLPFDVVKAVADKITSTNKLSEFDNFDETTVFHLESLKQILCGFSIDFIKAIVK